MKLEDGEVAEFHQEQHAHHHDGGGRPVGDGGRVHPAVAVRPEVDAQGDDVSDVPRRDLPPDAQVVDNSAVDGVHHLGGRRFGPQLVEADSSQVDPVLRDDDGLRRHSGHHPRDHHQAGGGRRGRRERRDE